jgi:ATP-dependent Lon protease
MDVLIDSLRVHFLCIQNNLDTIPIPMPDRMEVFEDDVYSKRRP